MILSRARARWGKPARQRRRQRATAPGCGTASPETGRARRRRNPLLKGQGREWPREGSLAPIRSTSILTKGNHHDEHRLPDIRGRLQRRRGDAYDHIPQERQTRSRARQKNSSGRDGKRHTVFSGAIEGCQSWATSAGAGPSENPQGMASAGPVAAPPVRPMHPTRKKNENSARAFVSAVGVIYNAHPCVAGGLVKER
jgi:hypothetical protein